MKHPTRSTAALGAIAALCIAAPAAFAERPADIPAHPAHPEHPAQANEHSLEAYGVQQHTDSPGDDSSSATDPSTQASPQPQPQPPAPANPCGNPAARQVFAPWHDRMAYVLVPNGGFEQADPAWTLANGAAVVEGNEPSFLNDAADHQSLSLPAGSSATSPATCFAAQSPTFRLMARTTGDRHSKLQVDVVYTNQNGHKVTRTAGRIRSGDTWRPSKRLSLAIGRGKGRGRLVSSSVAFRLTPVGAGDWQVDDLFLDPRARH
jgi:hypothetical protein